MLAKKSATIELAEELIGYQSITPNDNGCQKAIADRLARIGFQIENLRFDNVDNLWAKKGLAKPLFVFAGHTDVVPPGPLDQWQTPPFNAEVKDGYLYGRGVSDMKGGIAAMVTAIEEFVAKYPEHIGSIALLLTSDEEGLAINGTSKVVELLKSREEHIDWCIVGEPTCASTIGDTIKNGRRGSLSGELNVFGLQGHIAYPQSAANPVHLFAPALLELCEKQWDHGNEYFQPTSFQISHVSVDTDAENVIPGKLKVKFNFRFSPELTADEIQFLFEEILNKHKLKYELHWRLSGNPFLTPKGKLVDVLSKSIKKVAKVKPELSTTGGTSDARFIATMNCEVVEFGLNNTTIHKVDECAAIADLDTLHKIYKSLLEELLLTSP